MNDARQHARHKIEVRADVLGRHAWVGLALRDISVGGCCVQFALQEEPGARLELLVSFPSLDTHLSVEGVVVHQGEQQSGIRFELANEDQRWALRSCIRQCLEAESGEEEAPARSA